MITATTKRNGRTLAQKIRELENRVGNTPVLRPGNWYNVPGVTIVAKKEWLQTGGSVKARAAYYIIKDAIEKGQLNEDTILLDATSGNTGIAYATIAREIGLRVSLCLPENASAERKEILQSLGVELLLTSRFEGTDGAQERARELAEKHPGKYFYADQYKNDNNWKAHYYTTAPEIWKDVPDITHFVAGLGTTGTFTGTARRLRELNPSIRFISLQPDSALHGMEGWKHLETAVVPAIYDPEIADDIINISTEEAYDMLLSIYKEEQLLLSPSSAANIAGAIKVAQRVGQGTIVTVLPDNADKYADVINKLFKQ